VGDPIPTLVATGEPKSGKTIRGITLTFVGDVAGVTRGDGLAICLIVGDANRGGGVNKAVPTLPATEWCEKSGNRMAGITGELLLGVVDNVVTLLCDRGEAVGVAGWFGSKTKIGVGGLLVVWYMTGYRY